MDIYTLIHPIETFTGMRAEILFGIMLIYVLPNIFPIVV